jgi:thiamine-monophosphate kinase
VPLDELSIIDRFFRPLAGEGAFGLLDDAAQIAVPSESELVVTTDMIAEGVHFLPGDPPDTIAKKALRVNLSDLAAKGAKPLSYVLSLGISREVDEGWLAGFASGLRSDQETFGISLLGGDTIGVLGGVVASITAFGLTPKGRMVHRMGGNTGDALFATGTFGRSNVGLAILKREAGPWDALSAEDSAAFVECYRVPEPRVTLAPALAAFASAAMDVSDGLVGDCDKLAAASGCSARIDADRVPFAVPVGGDPALAARLLTGGEDFEILAAVSPAKEDGFCAAAEAAGIPVTRIGALAGGNAPAEVLFRGAPLRLSRRAYVHGQSEERP